MTNREERERDRKRERIWKQAAREGEIDKFTMTQVRGKGHIDFVKISEICWYFGKFLLRNQTGKQHGAHKIWSLLHLHCCFSSEHVIDVGSWTLTGLYAFLNLPFLIFKKCAANFVYCKWTLMRLSATDVLPNVLFYVSTESMNVWFISRVHS